MREGGRIGSSLAHFFGGVLKFTAFILACLSIVLYKEATYGVC